MSSSLLAGKGGFWLAGGRGRDRERVPVEVFAAAQAWVLWRLRLRLGLTLEAAARLAGVGLTTLRQSAEADYRQGQMQDVLNKLDELIQALRR